MLSRVLVREQGLRGALCRCGSEKRHVEAAQKAAHIREVFRQADQGCPAGPAFPG